MVKNQPMIHSRIGMVMRLAIPITHRQQEAIRSKVKQSMQNQFTNKETKEVKYTQIVQQSVF